MNDETEKTSLPMDNEIIDNEKFSLEGFQVVRGEFFAHIKEPSINFNNNKVSLNTACVNKLPDIDYVQILIHPKEMKLAVRPCEEDAKDSFLWCGVDKKNGKKKPRAITCRIFFAKVVQLMGWSFERRYKMMGKLIQSNGEYLFIFDLKAAEYYQRNNKDGENRQFFRTPIFPAEWQDQFGLSMEEHQKSLQINIFDGYTVFGLKDNQREGGEDTDGPSPC